MATFPTRPALNSTHAKDVSFLIKEFSPKPTVVHTAIFTSAAPLPYR